MALFLVLGGPLLAAGGCGPLLFLPSDYTPQKVELIYSVQENITLVRWRIASEDPADRDLSFDRLDETGAYQPIDFSQSVYPGGGTRCTDGTGSCFQYVVWGHYAPPATSRPVRAHHAPEGVLPGEPPASLDVETTLGFVAFFAAGNQIVYLNITDSVAYDGAYAFPRSYDRAMWPTKGLCVSGSAPATAEFSSLDLAAGGFAPPDPLTDDGIYCVGLRAVPADAGDTAMAQNRVATLPEVAPVHLSFTPQIERSPIIYQIVLDLQIFDTDRCSRSVQLIEQQVQDAMNSAGVPTTQLPTINLAVDPNAAGGPSQCSQPPQRSLPADQLAEQVKQIVSTYPERYQQFHFFYFNNLSAPLPPSLTSSLTTLFDDVSSPPPDHLTLFSWIFNPGAAVLTGPSWWRSQPWQGVIDDPTLSQTLTSYAQQTLPYTSQVYDTTVPVPFFTSDQVAAYGGGMFKICSSNIPFTIVDTQDAARLGGGPTWPIDATDPPGFFVRLQTPVAVAAPAFVPVGVEADLEVCTRYCTDHPYVAVNSKGVTSWSASRDCQVAP